VYRTVYRFEDLGEDRLLDRRAYRALTKVTANVEAKLVGYIEASPAAADLGRDCVSQSGVTAKSFARSIAW
jgi:hypothetical protein